MACCLTPIALNPLLALLRAGFLLLLDLMFGASHSLRPHINWSCLIGSCYHELTGRGFRGISCCPLLHQGFCQIFITASPELLKLYELGLHGFYSCPLIFYSCSLTINSTFIRTRSLLLRWSSDERRQSIVIIALAIRGNASGSRGSRCLILL